MLTEAGEAIAAELANAEEEITRLAAARTERLTVATFTSGGQRLLPAALLPFTGGISMIPQVALIADRGGLATVPLAPPCPSRFVGVVTASRRPRPLAAAPLSALRDTAAGLPDDHGRAPSETAVQPGAARSSVSVKVDPRGLLG